MTTLGISYIPFSWAYSNLNDYFRYHDFAEPNLRGSELHVDVQVQAQVLNLFSF